MSPDPKPNPSPNPKPSPDEEVPLYLPISPYISLCLRDEEVYAHARRAALTVTCAVPLEAELLGILPSASVLAVHHVFNAVLAACADRLRLTPEQVRIYHPGGSVGRDVQ